MKRTISLKWYRCPLCEAKEFEIAYVNAASLARVNPEPLAWDVVTSICKTCGLVQSDPRPMPSFTSQIYRPEEASLSNQNIDSKPKEPNGQALKVRKEQLSFIKRVFSHKENAKILDIGCNDGFLLSQLKQAGHDVIGVEPDLGQAMKAINRDIPVMTVFYQNAPFLNASFDLISAFHVLEHIHNPHAFLKKVYRELKPNGYVCLEVPDFYNPNATKLDDYFNCQHMFYYTPTTLKTMLSKIGFKPVKLIKKNYYAFRILAQKVGEKASPKPDVKEVERARKIIDSYKVARLRTLIKISKKIESALSKADGDKRVVIWGAGQHTYDILRLTMLQADADLLFVDSDPQKHLSGFLGQPVFSPSELPKLNPSLVLVSSYAFQKDIATQLENMGVEKNRVLTLYNDVRTYDGM